MKTKINGGIFTALVLAVIIALSVLTSCSSAGYCVSMRPYQHDRAMGLAH